jgi:hypothetical protein
VVPTLPLTLRLIHQISDRLRRLSIIYQSQG